MISNNRTRYGKLFIVQIYRTQREICQVAVICSILLIVTYMHTDAIATNVNANIIINNSDNNFVLSYWYIIYAPAIKANGQLNKQALGNEKGI